MANEKLKQVYQDTIENLMKKSAGSFACWQEKNGENHCLYSCTSEQFVSLLTHLFECYSNVVPFSIKADIRRLNDEIKHKNLIDQ